MRPGFWPKCRVCLRWCRISLLLVVLAAACVLLWFNQVGLPVFLKDPLLKNLRERGILVTFTRMRLRMTRGIVAENVQVGAVGNTNSPQLSIREVQLILNFPRLFHGDLQVQGLVLREGRLRVPVNGTNQSQSTLELTNIQTDLRFSKNETWALDNFQADFNNIKLAMSGDIAHAMQIRQWELFRRNKIHHENNWQVKLQQVTEVLEKIHLDGTPHLILNIEGDGQDPHSFDVRLQVLAPGARTPWFSAQNLQFAADLTAPTTAPTNLLAGTWSNLQPYRLTWSTHFAQLRSARVNARSVSASGSWNAPALTMTNLVVDFGQGQADAAGSFDVASQRLTFTNSSAFHVSAIAGLLPKTWRDRLALISWTTAPQIQVGGIVDLSVPETVTNGPAGWLPLVALDGNFAVAGASIHGLSVDQLETHFSYSNLVWQLPDLLLVQQKTRLQLDGTADTASYVFRLRIQGGFDLNTIRPWLKNKTAIREVNRLGFQQPLVLDVRVQGGLHDLTMLTADGQLALTNFSARGGPMDSVTTGLHYTNRVVEFLNPCGWRLQGTQVLKADKITLELNEHFISFTNGFSTADPEFVANSIGPKTGRVVAPYEFLEPPTARVNGYVSLRSTEDNEVMEEEDLRVDVIKGAPFRWKKFATKQVVGTIHWFGGTLDLTDLKSEFYGGRGDGSLHFDFRPRFGTDFSMAFSVTNANLHWLMVGLVSPKTELEGLIGGWLKVTSGNTTNWQLMNGYGNASLRDGLIWDAPIFGILSPALNKLSPGLGSSRATDAAATFMMTNGVIYSDTLEIHSTLMRLKYAGTVDLDENLNARATAQPLRDTRGVGSLISAALWPVSKLFEYKVTGTLRDPKMTPLYDVSKLLLAPLHPIKSLEAILPVGNTNAVSVPPPPRR